MHNCTFTNEMQEKHPCFRKGRNDYEAECLVRKSGTYISVVYKGNGDLDTHLYRKNIAKQLEGLFHQRKRLIIMLQQEANAKMKSLPQKALLYFMLLSIIIAYCPWTVHRSVLLKKIFPDSNVA